MRLPDDFAFFQTRVLKVSVLLQLVRRTLEQSFPLLWVAGEVSNFTRAASGHWYFTLKDENTQVRCVMFRTRNQYLEWQPRDGMAVEAEALVNLYEPKGEFQLTVESMRHAGLGALYEAFEKLKSRLNQEGLFEPARKRPVPAFPNAIGIITSPQAAALRDVLTSLRRRSPGIPCIVYPTPLQGEGAAQKIAAAIRIAGRHARCDVLILCRGGGSIEDLWPFNEEVVARAIVACPIPIVSGIGHETDFTIADFVADHRAPTPTGAAVIASPNRADLLQRLQQIGKRLANLQTRALEARMQHLDHIGRRLIHPGERLRNDRTYLRQVHARLRSHWTHVSSHRRWRLDRAEMHLERRRPKIEPHWALQRQYVQRLTLAAQQSLRRAAARLSALEANLKHLNPEAVLVRGFSVVRTGAGQIVRSHEQVAVGDELSITFAEGMARTAVLNKAP